MLTNLFILFQVTKHYNSSCLSIHNHFPKVTTGIFHWTLCNNKCFLLLITLKTKNTYHNNNKEAIVSIIINFISALLGTVYILGRPNIGWLLEQFSTKVFTNEQCVVSLMRKRPGCLGKLVLLIFIFYSPNKNIW